MVGQKSIGKVLMKFDPEHVQRLVGACRYSLKHNLGKLTELEDSIRNNQIISKTWAAEVLDQLGFLKQGTHVAVLASWFGTVLYPLLLEKGCYIHGFDMDPNVTLLAKRIFEKKDVVQKSRDIWTQHIEIEDCDIIINTSCEHMPPMSDWPKYPQCKSGAVYLFQSNNMYGVKDHINCVDSLSDFIDQQHPMMDILWSGEEQLVYEGNETKRFMIVGQI
jgi:hypothetical protein